MTKYRHALPQLSDRVFIADGGMGTTLLFHEHFELPHFCSFHLLDDDAGREVLYRYFRNYLVIASELQMGFILDSGPTWRASADWGDKLGYDAAELDRVNRQAIDMMCELRDEFETDNNPIAISGCMGPRGDGYAPGESLSADAAQQYHTAQIETFSASEADLVTAMTMTHADEAVGIVRAAQAADIPVAISFTVETDGRLPTGQGLGEAITQVDAASDGGPSYYMINCAHPTHFAEVLSSAADWCARIRGIRLNASSLSHAELDEATELDDGDPTELGKQVGAIRKRLPQVNIVGGCCGTDQRHIRQIALNAR